MKLKVEISQNTAETLQHLFDHVFKTGASITIEVDFDTMLHIPTADPLTQLNDQPENVKPEVFVNPKTARIVIR